MLYPFGYHGVPVLWADIPEEIRHLKPGWSRALDRDDDTLLVCVIPWIHGAAVVVVRSTR